MQQSSQNKEELSLGWIFVIPMIINFITNNPWESYILWLVWIIIVAYMWFLLITGIPVIIGQYYAKKFHKLHDIPLFTAKVWIFEIFLYLALISVILASIFSGEFRWIFNSI
jgi:hypothetical protein